MAWSNEWGKAANDAALHGTSIMQDGKHVPLEEFHNLSASYQTTDGILSLGAIGDLGLHWTDDNWMIYHLPTGTKFGSAVPAIHNSNCNCGGLSQDSCEGIFNYSREQLLNWMKKVQEPSNGCYEFATGSTPYNITGAAIRKCWTELRLLTSENYKDNGQSAKDIIKKWCLSVKVE